MPKVSSQLKNVYSHPIIHLCNLIAMTVPLIPPLVNPIPGGGVWSHPIPGVCAILHTPANFWTNGDTELKYYTVIDIHKLFPKIEKIYGSKC